VKTAEIKVSTKVTLRVCHPDRDTTLLTVCREGFDAGGKSWEDEITVVLDQTTRQKLAMALLP